MARKRKRALWLLPIALAALLAAALLLVLWWQVVQGKIALKNLLSDQTSPDALTEASLPFDPIGAEAGADAALLHIRRGDVLLLQGDFAAAEQEYQRSVEAQGGLPALRKLAAVQLQRRNLDGVAVTVEALKKAGARSEDVLLLQAVALLQKAELESANALLDAAPDSPHKHYGLGLLAVIQGQHDDAKGELRLAEDGWEPLLRTNARTLLAAYQEYALFPQSPELHLSTLLARALADVGQCELALPMLAKVTVQRDDYRDAWTVQGFCELVTERPKEALTSLQRAYNIDPQKPEIQYFLGRALSVLQDHENAVTFLQYALRNGLQPEREARMLLGREAALLGNAPLALEQFNALTRLPDATVDAFGTYVKTATSMGDRSSALVKAREATEKWPEDARAWELLGFAAKENGDKDDARQALENALQLDPGRSSAKELLESL